VRLSAYLAIRTIELIVRRERAERTTSQYSAVGVIPSSAPSPGGAMTRPGGNSSEVAGRCCG